MRLSLANSCVAANNPSALVRLTLSPEKESTFTFIRKIALIDTRLSSLSLSLSLTWSLAPSENKIQQCLLALTAPTALQINTRSKRSISYSVCGQPDELLGLTRLLRFCRWMLDGELEANWKRIGSKRSNFRKHTIAMLFSAEQKELFLCAQTRILFIGSGLRSVRETLLATLSSWTAHECAPNCF